MIFPFRKKTRLDEQALCDLHSAVYPVTRDAVDFLKLRVGENIHKKVRDFLKVHGKGSTPCPRCGTRISTIKANRR
jgi:formamidopyrimidine-DNA glycosylase